MTSSATPPGPEYDLATQAGRAALVREIRDMVVDHFRDDWQRRCADVAGFALYALRTQGVNSYRIACGRVVETPNATARTGKPPVTRYEGFLSPTGGERVPHVACR